MLRLDIIELKIIIIELFKELEILMNYIITHFKG